MSEIRMGTAAGRWVLLATVLGSGIAGIDATVVNVALPTIGADLGADFAALQWMVTGYTLTLASFILLGGSLGDRFGRRRVFVIGVIWFAVASLLCGLAPDAGLLIAARALQGVGGALLTPGSLAILQAGFSGEDRARAIGAWSGLGGVATAIGPFLGGWLVESVSWRWVFLINVPLAAAVVWIAARHVPESRDDAATGRIDVAGAVLGALALAGTTYALIEAPARGFDQPAVLASAVLGLLAAAVFLVVEWRTAHPMLPLRIFANRQFSAANAVTFLIYAVFGGIFFLLVLHLQIVAGFSPVGAGTSMLPITALMLVLSPRAGALGSRIGPRIPMTVGPLLCAVALVLMLRIGPGASYVLDVLPPVVVLGLGLSLLVAPLTSAALSAVPEHQAGLASGVNNAVARAAGLVAIAVLPAAVGLTGDAYGDPAVFEAGFAAACMIGAVVLVCGGLLAALTIRKPAVPESEHPAHCAVEGTPAAPGALHQARNATPRGHPGT
ncbi:DHA2 family efflux MFS transporter permease subunit [Arthrobacter agilis]|uniref:DHA2 family efflux MFS transporter permease subunit n=1 Tax=Arthrobacter agilis TaxID=37921 RepID=UPI00277E9EEA|nr:DHA2 family efflux MFS transporter permease subunit [Arthrobacter agilis]MDQ0733567.1 EmrB/QacA subfamily drug resistance transporter [Arthrobacter agilis]